MSESPLITNMSNELKRINEALEQISDADLTQLPDQVFRNTFLPFFAGDKNLPVQVTVADWISIAGSPFKGVQIIKDGQVLFTVPPIFDRAAVKPAQNGDGMSVGHIVRSAEQLNTVSPVRSRNYLDSQLAKKAMLMDSPINMRNYAEVWNTILTHYGYPALVELAPTPSTTDEKTPDNDPPEFDYTPL